jgi:hypothetical protein
MDKLTNYELLEYFKRLCMYSTPGDKVLIEQVQEEIHGRMEEEEGA